MNTKNLSGLWTALITPFKEGNEIDNPIDFEALNKILSIQIKGKVDGVLLLGTTAETPTISKEEGIEIVKFAVKKLVGKTKIMVNIGTYSTKQTIENLKEFEKIDDIDAYLVINPYYNKPTQTGLKKHFITIAKSTNKNIILYNIKGRTGVNLEIDTLLEIIKECKNVVGVKEASGDMKQMKEVISKTPDNFIVLSGDDALTFELINAGGNGVISVASNCKPKEIKNFVDLCLTGNEKSKDYNLKYKELFEILFVQTNPLPAKTYLANKGIIKEEFRLPMCKMDTKEKNNFLKIIEKYD